MTGSADHLSGITHSDSVRRLFLIYMIMDTELHPHTPFIPPNINCLILGSFPGRASSLITEEDNQWFYAAKRNQFWKIMAGVYDLKLDNRDAKEKLLMDQGIGIADILLEIRRKKDTNQDQDLEVIRYNDKAIRQILKKYPTLPILFGSRFVETKFKKFFPDYPHTALLPSPSPRYARLSLEGKIAVYKSLLPSPKS